MPAHPASVTKRYIPDPVPFGVTGREARESAGFGGWM